MFAVKIHVNSVSVCFLQVITHMETEMNFTHYTTKMLQITCLFSHFHKRDECVFSSFLVKQLKSSTVWSMRLNISFLNNQIIFNISSANTSSLLSVSSSCGFSSRGYLTSISTSTPTVNKLWVHTYQFLTFTHYFVAVFVVLKTYLSLL